MSKIIFLFSIIFTVILSAKPTVNESFEHYYISPKTVKDVKRELFNNTTIRSDGKRFLGSTRWQVKYKLKSGYNTARCKLEVSNISLDVLYTMPQVSDDVPAKIKYQFKRYYKKLLRHEENHKNNGLKAAKEIERKIRAMKPEKNCDILYSKIDKMYAKTIKKYNRLDKLYDKRTQHGKAEGVVIGNYFK